MLIWDDSLLVSSCIVVKSRVDLLKTVNGIVCPWPITSLKSFSPVWVLQQTHKRKWLHSVLPQNFHQSPSSITWYFWVLQMQILISDQNNTVWRLLTFEDIYIYIYILYTVLSMIWKKLNQGQYELIHTVLLENLSTFIKKRYI